MSDADSACRRFWVSGKVQGVYFRASARERARALGVTGWIQNLPDGRVEAVARGSATAVEAFGSWLATGPALAEVSAVASEVVDLETTDRFEVR